MDDAAIVDLYWRRDESAIAHTQAKYGAYCTAIAQRILDSAEDAAECVNDTYLGAWDAMPPHRPQVLSAFLGKITRNLSLKKLRGRLTDKRGGGQVTLTLDELEECLPAPGGAGDQLDVQALAACIDGFLATLDVQERRVFVCRYWHFETVASIAERFGFGESKVKMMLKRTRDKLRVHLEQEGMLA